MGLVTKLFDDPIEAEETVFGTGQCIAGARPLSIMTLSWFSGRILADGRHLWFGSWERIENICAALKVKKLAYLGSKLSTEGGRDWAQSGIKPSNPFGHLRVRLIDSQTVRVYGLPLMNIGPESIRYFAELNP